LKGVQNIEKGGGLGDVLPSLPLSLVLKKLNLIQQKHTYVSKPKNTTEYDNTE